MVLDHTAIRAMLPQRYPMLLLDRVTEVRPDGVTAIKAVSATEPCYRLLPDGLDPAGYAYPVALTVESFGQAAALSWLLADQRPDRVAAGEPLLPLFAGLRDLEFTGSAYPGDVLRHEVRLDHVMDGAAMASGEIWVGERRIARVGTLLAVIRASALLTASATV